MKLITATIKAGPHLYHENVHSSIAKRRAIFKQVNGTAYLAGHIRLLKCEATRRPGSYANWGTLATMMENEEVYQLIVDTSLDRDDTHFLNEYFCLSELANVAAYEAPTQMQLIRTLRMGAALAMPLKLDDKQTLGTVFPAIKLGGYANGYHMLLHEEGHFHVQDNYLQVPDPNYTGPELVLAKVSGHAVNVGSSENIILKLLKLGSTYQVSEGHNEGYQVQSENVTLPTEAELPIWERKQVIRRTVNVENKLWPLLKEQTALAVGVAFHYAKSDLEVQRKNWNHYVLTAGGPDYIAIDPADYKKVSYLPHSKVASVLEKGGDPWTSTSRVSVAWSKLVSNMFLLGVFSARDIELFHTGMLAAVSNAFGPEEDKPQMCLVSGEDIVKYYNEANYIVKGKGSLGSSCMRYGSDYFGLYAENPEVISLLISKDRTVDKIHGRALVWTKEGKQYLDRVYATSDVEQKRMQDWAIKQSMEDIWNGRRGGSDISLTIPLKMPYQVSYPYMDTMCHLNVKAGSISNRSSSSSVEMRSTGGTRPHLSEEVACAVSHRKAPKYKMVSTISQKHVLAPYATTLRTGGYEVKEDTVEDTLLGGIISKAQQALVRVDKTAKAVVTSQHNPNIVWVDSLARYELATDCAYSVLDKGYVLKEFAELMPDGSYCNPAYSEKYKTLLAKRTANKAKTVETTTVTSPAFVLEAVTS